MQIFSRIELVSFISILLPIKWNYGRFEIHWQHHWLCMHKSLSLRHTIWYLSFYQHKRRNVYASCHSEKTNKRNTFRDFIFKKSICRWSSDNLTLAWAGKGNLFQCQNKITFEFEILVNVKKTVTCWYKLTYLHINCVRIQQYQEHQTCDGALNQNGSQII